MNSGKSNIKNPDNCVKEDFPCSRSNSFESIDSLASVTSNSSSTRLKKYFCDYDSCNKSFNRPSLLTKHQSTVHHGIKEFKCPECFREFAKKSHLERHIHSHSDEKPFKCSWCGKTVTTRQQLKRHEVTHTKSFKCSYEGCDESFYKHPQLRSHILSIHLQKLKCQECGKNFQRPYRLKNHISKHHNPDVENKYQCSFHTCTQSFKTWSALQIHIKEDHPKLPCSICGKLCVGESGLQMHMIIHDDSLVIKNWRCSICSNLCFAKKAELLLHYMELHKDDIPNEILVQDLKTGEANEVENFAPSSTIFSSEPMLKKKVKSNEFNAILTEVKIQKYLESGKSSLSLLLNSAGRKFKCVYPGCYRSFKNENKFEKHLEKHKIHDLKLKISEEKGINNDSLC